MSEENKTVELKDEELEKVSGGIEYSISRVDAGDVFIEKTANPTIGYIVTQTTPIIDEDTIIPCKYIHKSDGKWISSGATSREAYTLLSNYQYSAELTGTINY